MTGVARAESAGRGSHLHCQGLSHTDEAVIRPDDRFDLGARCTARHRNGDEALGLAAQPYREAGDAAVQLFVFADVNCDNA